MEIFKNFGLDPVLLAAQIVNFLIIFYLLKRFLYKPVQATLNKRKHEIERGLRQAEESKKLLEDASQKESEILQKAQARADKILADAKTEAANLKTESEEKTKADTQKMIAQAREQIEQEMKAAEEKLIKNIGEIAVALLEKSLVGIFGKEEQKSILKKATAQIKNAKA